MANGYSFQSYPTGPTPDPKMVGAILAQKAAQHAADGGDQGDYDGPSGVNMEGGSFGGGDAGADGAGSDLLSAVAQQVGSYASSNRGTPAEGQPVATGGDGTGTPGIATSPPPLSSMRSQAESNQSAQPNTVTVDGDYTPGVEHSASATAAALDDAQRRTQGGVTGRGKVQNPSAASPLQTDQLLKMGLSPAEIMLLTQGGALKAG